MGKRVGDFIFRHLVSVGFMGVSLLAWLLWMWKIPPFTHPLFTHEGFLLHAFGGIGYGAFQVFVTQVSEPSVHFAPRFFIVQVCSASLFLFALEIMQYGDPARHIQLVDIFLQTLGVLFAHSILWFYEHVREHE